MNDVDELVTAAGAAVRDRVGESVDPDESLADMYALRAYRTRSRSSAAVLLIFALAFTSWLAWRPDSREPGNPVTPSLSSTPSTPSTPSPSPTPALVIPPAPGIAALPPLCGQPLSPGYLPAGFDPSAPCATLLTAGTYASAIVGLTDVWPFTMRLSDGWTAEAAGNFDWLDLRRGQAGLTVFAYPLNLAGPRAGSETLREWLKTRPRLKAFNEREAMVGGRAGWQVDLLADVPLPTDGCRFQTPCLPLVTAAMSLVGGRSPLAAAELHQGITSRLWVASGSGDSPPAIPAALWIWDVTDANTAAVVASIRFVSATEDVNASTPTPSES